ncbi:hypothetical protein SAMN04488065_1115 [Haloplanus vescus]|uniref:DUF7511 domain-containing protein n=1 Tax=Haloplanus vescus TaxID=555874 RepID=A0A1H3WSU1_9EURY|nr:hypothetical protein [Haloplanus vescus]SDZ90226.1 hypothetical protein SAMN04488065_1115 [Haloplanus vescus]
MSNTSTPDDAPASSDVNVDIDDGGDPRCLHSVVVTYEGTPDRQTLYPSDAGETERLTHWLTADADAFRHLDEMR